MCVDDVEMMLLACSYAPLPPLDFNRLREPSKRTALRLSTPRSAKQSNSRALPLLSAPLSDTLQATPTLVDITWSGATQCAGTRVSHLSVLPALVPPTERVSVTRSKATLSLAPASQTSPCCLPHLTCLSFSPPPPPALPISPLPRPYSVSLPTLPLLRLLVIRAGLAVPAIDSFLILLVLGVCAGKADAGIGCVCSSSDASALERREGVLLAAAA
jgi:hypothetical protein